MGLVSKLLPRFCGPFKILNKVGQVDYKLELQANSKVHLIFHVSCLRKCLIGQERPVDNSVLVEYVEPPILPHEPERVLDYHMLRTRHQVWRQALIKWKDRPEEGSTWEIISVLRKRFPTFVFEDEIFFRRRE